MPENEDDKGTNIPPEGQSPGDANAQPSTFQEQLHHHPVGARLPEHVAQGVFSTGVLVLEGPQEFVIDFVQGLTRPLRLASRVVISPTVMSQFVAALRDNLQKYEAAFGPPKELPRPTTNSPPSVQEIYRDLKMPDHLLSGVYATAVMIAHSPGEFVLDFITRFFPTAAVSARVYMSASHAPRMLEALSKSLQHYLNHDRQRPGDPPQPPGLPQ
jgi:hypothetical protein